MAQPTPQPAARTGDRSGANLSLSAIAIRLEGSSLTLFEAPYTDDAQLRASRESLAKDWFLWREGNSVLGLPKHAAPAPFGTKKEAAIGGQLKLIAARINDLLPSLFPAYQPVGTRPFRFLAQKDEVVAKLRARFQSAPPIFDKFKIRRSITLDCRLLEFRDGSPRLGLTCEPGYRWDVEATLGELTAAGIDVTGIGVCRRDPPPGERSFAGWVSRTSPDETHLDGNPALAVYPTDKLRVEGSRETFRRLLTQVLGAPGYATFESARALEESSFLGGPGRKEFLSGLAKWLKPKSPVSIGLGVVAHFQDPIMLGNTGEYQSVKPFEPVQFCFDPARTKRHVFPAAGLHNFGPYSADTFPKKSPTILVVVPEQMQGVAETFLQQMQRGFPAKAGAAYPGPWERGFARHFHLANPSYVKLVVAQRTPANPAADFRAAITAFLTKTPAVPVDIALVFLDDAHADLPEAINPYIQTKSLLMVHGIAVQEARRTTISAPAYSLQYNIVNIAVALYAKMGGVPWTISGDGTVSDELIIGMGQCEMTGSRFSPRQRYVGITTVFRGDGNYLLSNCAAECAYADYPETLRKATGDLLRELQTRNGWKSGDTVRLVFHSFKPLKGIEIGSIVAEAVKALDPSINFEHAFLTINQDHPYTILDHSNTGKSAGKGGSTKAVHVPNRGLCCQVTKYSKLLAVNGPSQIKTATASLPTPLLIQLHRDSSFRDLWYLSEQVYKFTGLSWRSVQPAPLPVTLLYSKLIARLLVRLKQVPEWSPAQLNTRLRSSRWFL